MNQYPQDPNQLPPHLRDDNMVSNSSLNPNHPSSAAYKPKSHKLRTAAIVTVSVLGGLFVFAGIINAVSGGSSAPVSVTAGSPVVPAATTVPTEDTADPTPAPHPSKAKPSMTASQEQAVGAARDYLEFTAFSRKALIHQLSSSAGAGFSVKDATFAVDYLKVDWNEQAAKAAKQYLEFTNFSRAGLIRQLESDAGSGFTHRQAVYGVSKAGL